MSCFIVSTETYNTVYATLPHYPDAEKVLTDHEETPRSFVKKLALYNQLAFVERYDGRHDDHLSLDDYEPVMEEKPCSLAQLVAHISCISYQAWDSTQYEKEYSHFVDKVLDALGKDKVIDTPEYEAAQWG
jgi:hypothetical protein